MDTFGISGKKHPYSIKSILFQMSDTLEKNRHEIKELKQITTCQTKALDAIWKEVRREYVVTTQRLSSTSDAGIQGL